jgi:methylamine dehydrogenase heavy chain
MFLVSYWGKVFPVDLSGDEPKPGESWSLTTEAERKDNWAPGGWQPLDYHSQSGQLFVLMDRRARWAHSSESREVWVFDTRTRKRVKTIGLAHEAACIAVDRADRPYLYALRWTSTTWRPAPCASARTNWAGSRVCSSSIPDASPAD